MSTVGSVKAGKFQSMSSTAHERGLRVTTGGTGLPRTMRRAASAVAAFMNYVAGWNYILCAVFITIDVLCRNFGGFSSSATTEITSYMLAFGMHGGWPMRWQRAPTFASTSWSIACPLACASISTHLPCFC